MAPTLLIAAACLVVVLPGLYLVGRRGALGGVLLPLVLFWDKGKRSLDLAVRSLWLHKLRAFLSVLGIIIGTAAVIALMAFGEGSMHDALEDIKRQGATNVIISSVKPSDDASSQRRSFIVNYGLTYRDYDRFLTIDSIDHSVPMRIFPQEIRRHGKMYNGHVVGTTSRFPEVAKVELLQGRWLVEKDELEMADVCVIGSTLAEELFRFDDPLGKSLVV